MGPVGPEGPAGLGSASVSKRLGISRRPTGDDRIGIRDRAGDDYRDRRGTSCNRAYRVRNLRPVRKRPLLESRFASLPLFEPRRLFCDFMRMEGSSFAFSNGPVCWGNECRGATGHASAAQEFCNRRVIFELAHWGLALCSAPAELSQIC